MNGFTKIDSFTENPVQGDKYITTNIAIYDPNSDIETGRRQDVYITSALWDTGASHCFITRHCALNLNLNPIDKVLVHHAGGSSWENLYVAKVKITPKYFVDLQLTECQSINNNFEIIIGMQVISRGDFAITNQDGKCTFSFRLPSIETIDFTLP